jgi:hypothetical protein
LELSRRLRQLGRPAYLDRPVTVSARRYEQVGWARVMWQNWRLRQVFYKLGPEASWTLYRRYYRRIATEADTGASNQLDAEFAKHYSGICRLPDRFRSLEIR